MKAWLLALAVTTAAAQPTCDKPVYLTFDTGHMGVAPLIAETLKRHNARATFFLASEPTKTGGTTLDDSWAPWWRERVAEGHDFGSHTWDHDVFLEDILDADGKVVRFKVRTQAGINPPVVRELTPEQYCASLKKVGERFTAMTGKPLAPLFRAPAGRTSAALLNTAKACGFSHVGWSRAGFLGDELPSATFPNATLLERALRAVVARDGQGDDAPHVDAHLQRAVSRRAECNLGGARAVRGRQRHLVAVALVGHGIERGPAL